MVDCFTMFYPHETSDDDPMIPSFSDGLHPENLSIWGNEAPWKSAAATFQHLHSHPWLCRNRCAATCLSQVLVVCRIIFQVNSCHCFLLGSSLWLGFYPVFPVVCHWSMTFCTVLLGFLTFPFLFRNSSSKLFFEHVSGCCWLIFQLVSPQKVQQDQLPTSTSFHISSSIRIYELAFKMPLNDSNIQLANWPCWRPQPPNLHRDHWGPCGWAPFVATSSSAIAPWRAVLFLGPLWTLRRRRWTWKHSSCRWATRRVPWRFLGWLQKWGLSENVGYIPKQIAMENRDNDQQNHWV